MSLQFGTGKTGPVDYPEGETGKLSAVTEKLERKMPPNSMKDQVRHWYSLPSSVKDWVDRVWGWKKEPEVPPEHQHIALCEYTKRNYVRGVGCNCPAHVTRDAWLGVRVRDFVANPVMTLTAPVLKIDINLVSEEKIKELVARCQPVIIRYDGAELSRLKGLVNITDAIT